MKYRNVQSLQKAQQIYLAKYDSKAQKKVKKPEKSSDTVGVREFIKAVLEEKR